MWVVAAEAEAAEPEAEDSGRGAAEEETRAGCGAAEVEAVALTQGRAEVAWVAELVPVRPNSSRQVAKGRDIGLIVTAFGVGGSPLK